MSMSMSIVELSRCAHHMQFVLSTLNMFSNADHPFAEGIEIYESALRDFPDVMKRMLLEDAERLKELANRCDAFINNGEGKV